MRVRVFGTLRTAVEGHKEIEIRLATGSTVQEALAQLAATYPELRKKMGGEGGQPSAAVLVLVNGRLIQFLDGPQTHLVEGDRLALFPPVGGG